VLEVRIVLQVPTPSALPHTWTLKWVYKELESATLKILFILMFLIIAFRKSIRNVMLVPFLKLFDLKTI
jgi:hypothetical protein